MGAKVHTHRYVRAVGRLTKSNETSGFIGYYKCADPGCSHYTKAELILGKKSICNRCGKEFVLPLSLRGLTNKPHCKDCTRKTNKSNKLEFAIQDSSVMDVIEDSTEDEDEEQDEMQQWIDLADEVVKEGER